MGTRDQFDAAMRHAGTVAVTTATVLGTLGILPQESVQSVITDIHNVWDGMNKVFGGVSDLLIILGPVAAVWIGKYATAAVSLKRQISGVAAADQRGDLKLTGQILTTSAIADSVPNGKVVAH